MTPEKLEAELEYVRELQKIAIQAEKDANKSYKRLSVIVVFFMIVFLALIAVLIYCAVRYGSP